MKSKIVHNISNNSTSNSLATGLEVKKVSSFFNQPENLLPRNCVCARVERKKISMIRTHVYRKGVYGRWMCLILGLIHRTKSTARFPLTISLERRINLNNKMGRISFSSCLCCSKFNARKLLNTSTNNIFLIVNIPRNWNSESLPEAHH